MAIKITILTENIKTASEVLRTVLNENCALMEYVEHDSPLKQEKKVKPTKHGKKKPLRRYTRQGSYYALSGKTLGDLKGNSVTVLRHMQTWAFPMTYTQMGTKASELFEVKSSGPTCVKMLRDKGYLVEVEKPTDEPDQSKDEEGEEDGHGYVRFKDYQKGGSK